MVVRLLLVSVLATAMGCLGDRVARQSGQRLSRAIVMHNTGRSKEALELCNQELKDAPNCFVATMLQAEIRESLGEVVGARRAYERAFLLRPSDRTARYQLRRTQQQARAHEQTAKDIPSLSSAVLGNDATRKSSYVSTMSTGNVQGMAVDVDKSYRHPVTPSPPVSLPGISSSDTQLARLLRALAEGQKMDRAVRRWATTTQKTECFEGMERHEPDLAPPQVVRFDLGLGIPIDTSCLQPAMATTGRHGGYRPSERLEDLGHLVGQSVPRRQSISSMLDRSVACLPVVDTPERDDYRLRPICDDGLDNNGNGLIDRQDPSCWQDGVNSSTYSRYIDEAARLLFLEDIK